MQTPTTRLLVLSIFATTAAAQWQLATPAVSPSARVAPAMCLHSLSGSALLFGGSAGFSSSSETWSYNGTTWALLTPPSSPSSKVGSEMVYDVVRGVVVMYGGASTSFFGGPSVDETWEWNGTTWTQVFPTVTPGGLGYHGISYDSARSRVVIYGGSPNSFFPIATNGTWEFDGTNWTLMTTVGSPGPLERPAMCFHAGINRTVLFGGIDPQFGGVDTTWLYNGSTWVAAAVTGPKPAVRTGAKMVYDSDRGVCVLSGGMDPTNGAAIVDTWEFDGANWQQVASVTTGRINAAMAYMPAIRRVVQFGGGDLPFSNPLGDHWEYSRALVVGTGCAGSNGVPALSAPAGPRLGQNYTLNLANLVTAMPVAVLVLSVNPIPATSLAVIGMPGCSAYLSPDVLLTIGASAGSASFTFAIPGATNLVGVSLLAQGLSLDPGVNAAELTTSNAVDGRLGQ